MTPLYLLYSARAQGWVYRNGTYGTLSAEARQFTAEEAVEYAKRAMPKEGASSLFPVSVSLLTSIQGQL